MSLQTKGVHWVLNRINESEDMETGQWTCRAQAEESQKAQFKGYFTLAHPSTPTGSTTVSMYWTLASWLQSIYIYAIEFCYLISSPKAQLNLPSSWLDIGNIISGLATLVLDDLSQQKLLPNSSKFRLPFVWCYLGHSLPCSHCGCIRGCGKNVHIL